MKHILAITASLLALFSTYASAHHSFGAYAINDPIEFAGVTTSFKYVNPHPILTIQETNGRLWTIEITPRNWGNTGLEANSDVIQPGDELRIRGWPARNGAAEMVLSGFELNGTYHELTPRIRQKSAVEEAARLDGLRE